MKNKLNPGYFYFDNIILIIRSSPEDLDSRFIIAKGLVNNNFNDPLMMQEPNNRKVTNSFSNGLCDLQHNIFDYLAINNFSMFWLIIHVERCEVLICYVLIK